MTGLPTRSSLRAVAMPRPSPSLPTEGFARDGLSYTIAAPIWKTTYRVVLDAAGQPFFQGAIVDNVSEEELGNVQLSPVSGTPVSFINPIQKPFYRYRRHRSHPV